MFESEYKIDSEHNNVESKFRAKTSDTQMRKIIPGTYNSGELTIFDKNFNTSFAQNWSWLIGPNAEVIASLCWGDFIYACPDKKLFYIVLVDSIQKISMGNTLNSVFNRNFCSAAFRDEIINPEKLQKVRLTQGQLEYGECYALQKHSGVFKKSDLQIFLDILGQTSQQMFSRR